VEILTSPPLATSNSLAAYVVSFGFTVAIEVPPEAAAPDPLLITSDLVCVIGVVKATIQH